MNKDNVNAELANLNWKTFYKYGVITKYNTYSLVLITETVHHPIITGIKSAKEMCQIIHALSRLLEYEIPQSRERMYYGTPNSI